MKGGERVSGFSPNASKGLLPFEQAGTSSSSVLHLCVFLHCSDLSLLQCPETGPVAAAGGCRIALVDTVMMCVYMYSNIWHYRIAGKFCEV